MEEKELLLTLIRGTVSWESRSSYSIIEIVFMSESVAGGLNTFKLREQIGEPRSIFLYRSLDV